MDFILQLHSGVRWLVILMTVVAFAWLLVRYLQNQSYDKRTHGIVAGWAGLVGLQWIIGIIFILVLGTYTGTQWSHAGIMTVALAVAHTYVALKKRPDKTRFVGGMASIIGVMVLVFVGVQMVNG
ncbi:MAG TPA: hypothetical protein PLZ51_29730, partial [Aggregatilineales bacterium]|nr:hypothetical protein [Aggregatilineales bacterium]